jgi:hypothetical protein
MENSKYLHAKVVALNVTNLDKFYLLGVELIQGRRLVLLDGCVLVFSFHVIAFVFFLLIILVVFGDLLSSILLIL